MSTPFAQSIAHQHRCSQIAHIVCGVLLLLLTLTTPIACIAWLDAAFVFTPIWRWLAFSTSTLATLFALAYAYRRLHHANPRATTAAMDAGSSLPTGYIISTSAEFAAATAADSTQQAMLDRLHAEAAKLAATSQPRHPWPGTWLLSTAAASLALTVALLLTHGLHPILRMVVPWQPMPYTHVTLAPIHSTPAKNEPFTLTGTIRGRIPADVDIFLANGQRLRAPVTADGAFHLTFADGIAAPTTATARAAADGVSRTIPLDLRTIPTLAGYQHTIIPPAYTGLPARKESHPSFALLSASRVHFAVTFHAPPTGVRMVFDNARAPLDLTPSPENPLVWHADLGEIPRTFGYQLDATDAMGTYPVEETGQQIVVTSDNPPTIAIRESNAGKIISGNDTLTLTYSAHDDIGLTDIAVTFYRVGDFQRPPTPIATFKTLTVDHNGDWLLPLANLNARPMDTLVVILQARDNNTLTGPGIGYSEPLILEIPENPTDKATEPPPSEGESGPSAEVTQINPLELQRQIYRDTLRASLRHTSAPIDELTLRQQEIPKHLEEMAKTQIALALGDRFVTLLKIAASAAQQSGAALANPAAPDLQESLKHQANGIKALVEAARIEMAAKAAAEEPPPGESEKPAAPQTVFTLTGKNTPPPAAPDPEAENQERLAQARLDLQKALEEQEKLNQEANQNAKEGKPSSPSSQAGKGNEGGPKPGNGPNSETPPSTPQSPSSPSSPSSLAERQLALAEFSGQIEAQIEELRAAESATDPKLAAEQMRRAAEFQRQAADGLLQKNPAGDSSAGAQSEDAIRRALIITESLLGGSVQAGIEAASQPAGYQGLIQNYSRRLSYDQ